MSSSFQSTTKKIEEAASKAIDKGLSHQEAFEMLSNEFNDKEAIFEALSNTPKVEIKKRYKWWNYLLGLFLLSSWATVFYALSNNLYTSFIFLSLYYFFLLKSVLKWRIKNYFWIAVFSGVFIVLLIVLSIIQSSDFNNIEVQLLVFQGLIIFILCIWLWRKVQPKGYQDKIKVKDDQNRLVFRKVFRFED